MKKLILLLLLFKAFQCEAQTSIKGAIEFKDSVITRTVTFKVEKGARKVGYSVEAYIKFGKLAVSLTDPNGKQHGGFELGSEPDATKKVKPSKGTIANSVDLPVPGTWLMNISVKKGTGHLSYEINPGEL
jgi:hypothetical protein